MYSSFRHSIKMWYILAGRSCLARRLMRSSENVCDKILQRFLCELLLLRIPQTFDRKLKNSMIFLRCFYSEKMSHKIPLEQKQLYLKSHGIPRIANGKLAQYFNCYSYPLSNHFSVFRPYLLNAYFSLENLSTSPSLS